METLESERLQQVQNMLTQYSQLVETIVRPTEQLCEELIQTAGEISPESDIILACSSSGTGPNQPEQLLMDCYVSHSCHCRGCGHSLHPGSGWDWGCG